MGGSSILRMQPPLWSLHVHKRTQKFDVPPRARVKAINMNIMIQAHIP